MLDVEWAAELPDQYILCRQLYYPDGAPYRCPLCSYTTSTGQGLSHHATFAHRADAEPVGGIIGLHDARARL